MYWSAVSVTLNTHGPGARTAGDVAVVKIGILSSLATGAAAMASPVATGPITITALSRVAIRVNRASASWVLDRLSSIIRLTLVAPK